MPDPALDTPTMLLLQGALALLLPLVAWSILLGRHDATATALWCGGGALGGVALLLIAVRPALPWWLGVPGTIALALASYLLRSAALRRELGRRVPWKAVASLLLLAVIAYVQADGVSLEARELVGMLTRWAAAGWLAFAAWQLYRHEASRSAAMVGVVCGLLALAFAWRGIEVLLDWGQAQQPGIADYAPIAVASMLVTLFGQVGYVGLAWERSRARERARAAELEAEHARLLRAEQHARELDQARAERRAQINEAVPAMLHSIDARGVLVAVSDTWLDKLGYTRAEVIGRASVEFLTPASRDYARQTVLPEFFRTGRCDNVAYQMQRKDGSVIDVRLSAVLERDAAGQPLRSLAVIEDVSDLRARQEDLQREQAQRRQAEQHSRELDALLAERSEMLRVLAHEVRQPLNNASAALQDAQAELARAGPGPATHTLLQARGVLADVLTGLDNTLAVAALLAAGQARAEDADVDTLLDIARADLPPASRGRVRVDRASPTRTASLDTSLMRLALRNLLANALAYSAPGSPVTIRVLDSDAPLALVLEVESAGPPIADGLVPRLFERGTRGQALPDKPGSGLGLYIVRRVMELHRGTVELRRNDADAVVFRLVLPQALDA